jgi:hypothetical protein
MKWSIEALVAGAVVLVLAAAPPAARAVSPVVEIDADASLDTSRPNGSPRLHIKHTFTTDTPGAPPLTIQKAVVFFPDRAGTNGHLFPSCSAAQIARLHGDIRRCPRGSRIGGGTLKARALQLGITAYGRVAIFNGPGGRTLTFNIQSSRPALINESIDAPLTRVAGGEQFSLVVPHSLQEIIEGVFVGLEDLDLTLSAATRVRGVRYPYFAARRCPDRPIHAVFDFQDWETGQLATTTTDSRVRCTER